ncbi:hypothetical protein J6590_077671 [Homalodisca vitripennis]|nr:hypothetical protein J6590_077671 [Homalodisca vitripennis]
MNECVKILVILHHCNSKEICKNSCISNIQSNSYHMERCVKGGICGISGSIEIIIDGIDCIGTADGFDGFDGIGCIDEINIDGIPAADGSDDIDWYDGIGGIAGTGEADDTDGMDDIPGTGGFDGNDEAEGTCAYVLTTATRTQLTTATD